ncbi:MAG: GTP cyclohydrolase FolE2 [Pseudomonadota bacterium]
MYRFDTLPDVTSDTLRELSSPLQWVGMEQIDVPIRLARETADGQTSLAKASVYVSLRDGSAKGIHMSRLYSILNQLDTETCSKSQLDRMLDQSISSQAGISDNAKIELAFDLLLKKQALRSGESGYQTYPMKVSATLASGKRNHSIEVTIPYSSTCPCSASLSRQQLANAIDSEFSGTDIDRASLLNWIQSERGSVATPHAQRSYAYVKLIMDDNPWPEFSSLILQLEAAIGTPVQTAVKRVDEQEFAKINAENLMFCEDAARRIKGYLEQSSSIADYWLKVEHQESLHPHNAVVIDQK